MYQYKSMKLYVIFLLLMFFNDNSFSQIYPKREMRAVWITTVGNLDWPSSKTIPVEQQKTEMLAYLDLVIEFKLNTVIFQIRPSSDAFYVSKYEPWSEWFNGKQGKAPEPFYDPLQFVITECRKRGLDIHVWINPYRAVNEIGISDISENHITKKHPEWFIDYGNKKYFDPGLPQSRDYISSIVSDIVRHYDIDAIHMDDYFYPFRIANKEFRDSLTFTKYPNGFTFEKRHEWRRNNVNLIIKQIQDTIKAIKPWIEFGISPFGVWRNRDKDSTGSDTKAGQTNYDDLFADVLKWQKEGWIDYVMPQLYWEIGKKNADYAKLIDWWSKNTFGCQLYIGHAPFLIDKKSKTKAWRNSKEMIKQINLNKTIPNVAGSAFFRIKHLQNNPLRLKQKLIKIFEYIALPTVNSRTIQVKPDIPKNPMIKKDGNKIILSWEKSVYTKFYVIYKFKLNKPASIDHAENIFRVTSETSISFDSDSKTRISKYYYMITALSKSNLESQAVFFR